MEIYSYSSEFFATLSDGTYRDSFINELTADFLNCETPLPEGGIWVSLGYLGISVYCHPECGRWGYTPMNFFRLSHVWHVEVKDNLVGCNTLQGGRFSVPKKEVFEIRTNKEIIGIHRSADGQFKIVGVLDTTNGNYGDYSHYPDFITAMEKVGYSFSNFEETLGISYETTCGSALFSIYSSYFGHAIKTVVASGDNSRRYSDKSFKYLCPSVRDILVGKRILTAHTEHYVRGDSFKSEYMIME